MRNIWEKRNVLTGAEGKKKSKRTFLPSVYGIKHGLFSLRQWTSWGTVSAFHLREREGCGELEASDPRALIPFLYCLRSATPLTSLMHQPTEESLRWLSQPSANGLWSMVATAASPSRHPAAASIPSPRFNSSITLGMNSPSRQSTLNDI